ncbi:MAG: PQQ-binding-like beta-propeller repeat protein [Planctomycetota bacterium]
MHAPSAAFALLLIIALTPTPAWCDEGWPQFRGPTQQGVVPSGAAPQAWGEEQNIAWKTALPGRAWSSPVVLGGQVWLTTAVEQLASDAEAAAQSSGLAKTIGLQMSLAKRLSLQAVCVDRRSGELVRTVTLFEVDKPNSIHALNSYASPTPVLEAGRLYCHFGTYGNACLDTATGRVLWRRVLPLQHYVGPGSSPVVHDGLMVLTCDGADQQYVTALNTETGETAWKTDRPPIRATNPDFRKSYCTPLVLRRDGQTQIVVTGAQWMVAYDPDTGDELWRVDHGSGFSIVPRPVSDGERVYFSSGYPMKLMFAVRLGGRGDVTQTHVAWRSRRQTPTQPSPVLVGGRMYTVSDDGVGVCLDTADGSLVWQGRLGGTYSASPLLAGDRVYFFSREGETTVVRDAESGPEKLGVSRVDGRIMASPAVVDGVMYLRTDTHLYAIAEPSTT